MERLALVLGFACCVGAAYAQGDAIVEVTARGSFDDVKQLLVLAIENRGLVINHESNVGQMLARTGKDLGAEKQVYAQALVLEFCSATLSRQAMEADHRLLAFCPYGVGIYTLTGETDRVHLVYRRPRLQGAGSAAEALRRVDQLLHEIVQEAGQ
jgi:uncharacterized protein (DUF302 family)